MKCPTLVLASAILLVLPSCKKDDSAASRASASGGAASVAPASAPSTASEPSPADYEQEQKKRDQEDIVKYGYCELEVDGILKGTGRSPGGKHALGSDYFNTEEELALAEKFFPKKPGGAKPDPRIYIVILNCSNDVLTVNFGAGADTKYADMPFRPGKYKVGNQKGQMAALVTQRSKKNDGKVFRVSSGDFEFKRWDSSGAAGEFRFEAKEMAGDGIVRVKGTFDMKCPKGEGQCKRG